jgi:hypothetical protein
VYKMWTQCSSESVVLCFHMPVKITMKSKLRIKFTIVGWRHQLLRLLVAESTQL